MPTVEERLERIETLLVQIVEQQTVREHYSVEQAAKILEKTAFTVREYCRLGRVNARKKRSGRGKHDNWTLSHEEILRVQREGLLPLMPGRNQ